MKKFIKENWFKLGIIIIFFAVGIFYIANYKSSDIEMVTLKKECTKDANDYISKSSSVRNIEDPTFPMTQYDSVYIPELRTCLVNISRLTAPLHWYYAIIDIYAEKEIASYVYDKTDKESVTSPTSIDGYKKYDEMKKKYFSK